MSEDTIRNDLHPGKLPIQELWDMLCENIIWMKDNFHIDGIFLQKPYLLSEKLQKQICKAAKRKTDRIRIYLSRSGDDIKYSTPGRSNVYGKYRRNPSRREGYGRSDASLYKSIVTIRI